MELPPRGPRQTAFVPIRGGRDEAGSGAAFFGKSIDNVGVKSIPDYEADAQQHGARFFSAVAAMQFG